jgi:hypothetical protein
LNNRVVRGPAPAKRQFIQIRCGAYVPTVVGHALWLVAGRLCTARHRDLTIVGYVNWDPSESRVGARTSDSGQACDLIAFRRLNGGHGPSYQLAQGGASRADSCLYRRIIGAFCARSLTLRAPRPSALLG